MIYLVHGNDQEKVRAIIFNQQKKLGVEKRIELKVGDLSQQELSSHILVKDIFGESKFFVFDVTLATGNQIEYLAKLLNTQESSTDVYIVYSSKSLATKELEAVKSLTLLKEVKFDIENTSNVFNLLDAVYSKSRKQAYQELNKLTESGADPFYIFSMLLYGLRNLFFAKDNAVPFQKMKPFQKSKLSKQAELFSVEILKNIHKSFFEQEILVKSKGLKPDLFLTFCIEKVLHS